VNILGIVPARGGSQGVPGKNVRKLLGKPVISYTLDTALASSRLDRIVVTSDDPQVKAICREHYHERVTLIDRPDKLAGDTARIDDVMRHACRELERLDDYHPDIVVLLYANVPVRAEGIIDRATDHLITTGADSVQTLAPVGKFHPFWLYRLEGDKATKYIDNTVFQRQDLPPLYTIDGAVGVVRYTVLTASAGSPDPHAFWGTDRRGFVQSAWETVDIDTFRDLYLAETVLREKQLQQIAHSREPQPIGMT